MMLWITSLALAAPDRVAAELTDVTGTDELRVLESADLVAVLDGTNVHLLDLETWDVYTASSGCSGGLALWEAEDGTPTLAVGCSDGSVASMTWDGSALSGVTNTDLLIGTVYSMEYGGSYLFAVASGTFVAWRERRERLRRTENADDQTT